MKHIPYTVSTFVIPSDTHKGYGGEKPSVRYRRYQPEDKDNPFFISLAACPTYLCDPESAEICIAALEEFFDRDILPQMLAMDWESVSRKAYSFVVRKLKEVYGFENKRKYACAFSAVILDLDSKNYYVMSADMPVYFRGRKITDPYKQLVPSASGSLQSGDCLCVMNTVCEKFIEDRQLDSLFSRAMKYTDDKLFEFLSEEMAFSDRSGTPFEKEDGYFSAIIIGEE